MNTNVEDPRVVALREKVAAGRRRWRAAARVWVADHALGYVEKHPDVTVSAVLEALDKQTDQPPGYKILSNREATRYQFVRRVLHELADEGALSTRETSNSRNRPATAFAPAGWLPPAPPRMARPSFEVIVDANTPEQGKLIEGEITAWLEKHKIQGVNALMVTRLPDGTETPADTSAAAQSEGFQKRRRRAVRSTVG